MEEYNAFLKCIVANPILNAEVKAIAERGGLVNLVDENWADIIDKLPLYQKHKDNGVKFSVGKERQNVKVQSIIGSENCYNIVVAGKWSLRLKEINDVDPKKNKDTCLVNRTCLPLVKIAKVLAESPNREVHSNFKFFVEKCSEKICNKCYIHRSMFTGPKDDWCVVTSKLFDGEEIVNTCKSRIEETFGGLSHFSAILVLTINSRVNFSDAFKISGSIREFILFKDSVVLNEQHKNINLPNIIPKPDDEGENTTEEVQYAYPDLSKEE